MQPTTQSQPTPQPNSTPTTGSPVEQIKNKKDKKDKKDKENGGDTKEADSEDRDNLTLNPTPTKFKQEEESFRKLKKAEKKTKKTDSATDSTTEKTTHTADKKTKKADKDRKLTSAIAPDAAVINGNVLDGRRLMALPMGAVNQSTLLSGAVVVAALVLLTLLGLRRAAKLPTSASASAPAGKQVESA